MNATTLLSPVKCSSKGALRPLDAGYSNTCFGWNSWGSSIYCKRDIIRGGKAGGFCSEST